MGMDGVGRSARGLPIVVDSPRIDELRGVLWKVSPAGVRAGESGRKRSGSMLAQEGIAKKRKEGT